MDSEVFPSLAHSSALSANDLDGMRFHISYFDSTFHVLKYVDS